MIDRGRVPPPQVARDALVGPMLPGSNKTRHLFTARTGDVVLEHLRTVEGEAADMNEVSLMSDADVARAVPVPGVTLYGGVFTNHFGHMLAETVHRLWAAALLPEYADVAIAFQVGEGRTLPIEPWMLQIFAQFGIGPERLLFVNRPMRFEELHVPRQGRVLGGVMPIEGYADLFPVRPIAPEWPASPRLYVSRRQFGHRGTYLGESMIETALQRDGYEVVYPETLPFEAVLRKLVGAREIVFCEGSAIHHLEVTGRIDARVFVIGRRAGTRHRFSRLLEATAREYTIFGKTRGTVCLEWDRMKEVPFQARTCSFVDLPALVRELSAFSGVAMGVPDEASIRRAESLDLLRYILDPRVGQESNDEQIGRLLRMMREAPDVKRLLPRPRRSRGQATT